MKKQKPALKFLDLRPYQLMCLVCRLDEGRKAGSKDRLDRILKTIRAQPDIPVTLRCNVEGTYRYQNPGRAADTPEGPLFNLKRDLDILQKFGLAPGDTRPARELFERLYERIKTTAGICGYKNTRGRAWRGCTRTFRGFYETGMAKGLDHLIPPRPADKKKEFKERTARDVLEAKILSIRPHHLMCMACFYGTRKPLAPIAEDNLYEAIAAIQKNPEIPVRLIAGCCMICPPCSRYEPKTGLCLGSHGMSLRDQHKDLTVLQRLGLAYGDTLPGRELFRRLFAAIPSTTLVCGYGNGVVRGHEWTVCGGPEGCVGYVKARQSGMGFLPRRAGLRVNRSPRRPQKKMPAKHPSSLKLRRAGAK